MIVAIGVFINIIYSILIHLTTLKDTFYSGPIHATIIEIYHQLLIGFRSVINLSNQSIKLMMISILYHMTTDEFIFFKEWLISLFLHKSLNNID